MHASPTPSRSALISLLLVSVFAVSLPSAAMAEEFRRLTRGEFIESLAHEQPANPLFPEGSRQLARETIYQRTGRILEEQGIDALAGKPSNQPITDLEFIRVAYAVNEGPPGKNLMEQKRFLKEAGFISPEDIGLADRVQGNVSQTHEGLSRSQPVETASSLFMNDLIRTGRKSRVAYMLEDNSTLTLSSGSSFKITKSVYDPSRKLRQTVIHLSKGMARFAVTRMRGEGSSFMVVTPRGVAGVRGTEFVAMVDSQGNARFVVLEGKIETAPLLPGGRLGERALVGAGQMRDLYNKGRASKVKRVSPSAMKKIRKQTTVEPGPHKKDRIRPQTRTASIDPKAENRHRSLKAKPKMAESLFPELDNETPEIGRSAVDKIGPQKINSLSAQRSLREAARLQNLKSPGFTRLDRQMQSVQKNLQPQGLEPPDRF